jgi:hypothetical protein
MNELDILIRKAQLSTVLHRVKFALDDLEQKAPHKYELIKSQKESVNDLLDVQELVYHLVDENKTYRLRNISLEKALILNEVEMQKMRDEVESIKQLL